MISAFAIGLFIAWLDSDVGTPFTRQAVSDVVFVVAPATAAWSCRLAARRGGPWQRSWWWAGLGCLVWAGGSTVWTFYELVLRVPAPFPSLADLGYVGWAIPIAIGVLRRPVALSSSWSRARVALDAVVIAVSLLTASGVWVLHPILSATTGSTFTRLVAVAYPLADVTIAALVLTRCTVLGPQRRAPWLILAGGLIVEALVDSTYVARTFTGSYTPGHLLDAGWMLSFLLIALAARLSASMSPAAEAATTEPTDTTWADVVAPPGLMQQLVPYLPVALGGTALVHGGQTYWLGGRNFWVTGVFLAVVAIRQFAVVADHASLTHDLSRAVSRRTEQLSQSEAWFRALVRNLTDVIVVVDSAGVISYCSPSIGAALGHEPNALTTATELTAHLHADDAAAARSAIRPVLTGKARHGFVECRIARADGTWKWFEITAVRSPDQELDGAVLTLHDVTDRRELTDRLAHQAFHDALTDLPNRMFLMEQIEQALARPSAQPVALMFIDLDDFKLINDSHGHGAGDLVLQEIGRRLQAAVRNGDVVARLGGDEFAVLLSGTPDDVQRAAERLVDVIEAPVAADGRRFVVRASVGVVFAARNCDETAASLLSHADIALYEAKARDKGGVVVVVGDDRDNAAKQVVLRQDIAQPDLSQFYVVYQPVVDVHNGVIRGVEALLRWRHPQLGEISPADFIPLAEHGGSIRTLGWFVLEESCRQLAKWGRSVPAHRLAIGVNVSIQQLDEPCFVARVTSLIGSYGLAMDQVVLELTEQSLAHDFETAVDVVAELRKSGVSVAVDDFGTGYSSLRYLHRFAADVVKIDRSFVASLVDSDHTQKLVGSVVHMAEALDLQTIAEGIETVEQLELVRSLGCELAQGYLFSRPVAPEQIELMLASGAVLHATAASPA
jgi:diguanylate cyclase (GGDEF)-like protein/PAS domain S-box-containing protein